MVSDVLVTLVAGNVQCCIIFPVHANAKKRKRLDGHVDVRAAFHGRHHVDGAVDTKQRQREQQAADELTANVAGYGECTGMQGSLYVYSLFILGKKKTLLLADGAINVHRPAHECRASRKGERLARKQAQGHEEAQRASAFAAGQHIVFVYRAGVDAVNCSVAVLAVDACAQDVQAVDGCQNILAVFESKNQRRFRFLR